MNRRPLVRRARRRLFPLQFEAMESRLLLATFTVTDVSDNVNDTGSLRYAITQSNLARPGPNIIDFNIPGTGLQGIEPSSALPPITTPVIIDGTSQPGYNPNNPRPLIALIGLNIKDPNVNGLTISAGISAVFGLDIVLFTGNGIDLNSNGGDVIDSSIIGTDFGGDSGLGNAGSGVMIDNVPGNAIGTSLATGNVLSGNNGAGLTISGSNATGNLVLGNYIGTDFTGSKPVGNVGGVAIVGAPDNTIGGASSSELNLISGNGTGLAISGDGATGNLVQGNLIGTDGSGTGPLGNTLSGVVIFSGAGNNTIGGATLGARNVISANGLYGILITSSGTGNLVQGNYIGTDVNDTGPLTNKNNGMVIAEASNNTIGGTTPEAANVIAGNAGDGITILGTDATGNLVEGNFIGTNELDSEILPNLGNGVNILEASNNTIGGTTPGARNVISANGLDGVQIFSGTGNLVQGNYIGTKVNGIGSLPNINSGVDISDASNNTIGGTAGGARNVISSNGFDGILISRGSQNLVQGNYVGIDESGTMSSPNVNDGVGLDISSDNTIGGTTPGAGNVISANHNHGVDFFGGNSNVVQGNFIGTDWTGTQPLTNLGNGVLLDGASNDTIGGTTAGAGNIIGRNNLNGIFILDGSTANLVQGNSIGTDVSGTQILSNSGDGVNINGASDNTIGGTAASARNIIAGNGGDGVRITNFSTGNLVQGNYIGTDISGTQHLANLGNGVEITNLSSGNLIGGTTGGARNLISGNDGVGVLLAFGSGTGNLVQGNYIGTDASGTQPLGNLQGGVSIGSGASNNTIGGMISSARNLIAGNFGDGISITGTGRGPNTVDNLVQGNYIGTDFSGTQSLGNLRNGVLILNAPNNLIGGTATGAGNVISGNAGDGISLTGAGSKGDLIEGDFIGTNSQGTGPLSNGQSNGQDGVAVFDASDDTVGGTVQGARNVISGNHGNGISFTNTPASDVVGNFIGTDVTGTQPVANVADGVLFDDSTGDTVGGTAQGAGNVISGNDQAGVEIRGTTSQNDDVEGNTIGPAVGGKSFVRVTGGLGNGNLYGVYINGSADNTVGGTNPSARNLISGNSRPDGSGDGVLIAGPANLIEGNFIGTDQSGGFPLGNDTGVFINGAAFNTIGGIVQGAGNVIAGYTTAFAQVGVGIDIANAGALDNLVEGNLIGTDATGERALVPSQQPASGIGVLINDAVPVGPNTPGSNTIGGVTAAARNVISGFVIALEIYAPQSSFNLVPGNTVEGNYIGTNASGVVVKGLGNTGNTTGIFVNGVPFNTIGGTVRGAGNVISGNITGIYLLGPTTSGNLVQGNYIGLDPTGTSAEPNHTGVFVNDAMNNTIGGTAPGAGNVIAGNLLVGKDGSTGIYFYSGAAGNLVQSNLIGTNASGKTGKRLGLGDYGILLYNAPQNTYPTRGKGANKIRGSGIAATREFSSSAPLATTSGTTSKGRAKSVPSGPHAHVRRPGSRK